MKICSNHQDYQVPLIWTFAWNGAEYWCPYCDAHEGMLEAGEEINHTKELGKRLELYRKATKEYRNARGTLICSETKWKGEWIKPSELPEEEIERLQKLLTWELNIKIEDSEFLKTMRVLNGWIMWFFNIDEKEVNKYDSKYNKI